jgi:hypothetical protein
VRVRLLASSFMPVSPGLADVGLASLCVEPLRNWHRGKQMTLELLAVETCANVLARLGVHPAAADQAAETP